MSFQRVVQNCVPPIQPSSGGSLCAPLGDWHNHCKENDPSGGEASHQEADHHGAQVNMTWKSN